MAWANSGKIYKVSAVAESFFNLLERARIRRRALASAHTINRDAQAMRARLRLPYPEVGG